MRIIQVVKQGKQVPWKRLVLDGLIGWPTIRDNLQCMYKFKLRHLLTNYTDSSVRFIVCEYGGLCVLVEENINGAASYLADCL